MTAEQPKSNKYVSPVDLMQYGDTRGLGIINYPPPPTTDYKHKVNLQSDWKPLQYDDPFGHEMAYLVLLNATQKGEQKDHVNVFHEPLYRVATPREGGVYLGGDEFFKAQEKNDVILGRVPLRQGNLDFIPKTGELNRDAILPPMLPPPDTLSILYTSHPMALN